MLTQSEQLFTFLTTHSDFTDVMGLKVYPIVGLEGAKLPFATYKIQEQQGLSFDGDQVNVQLFLWFNANEYSKCAAFVDKVKPLIENHSNYIWESQTVDYVEDAGTFVGIINFKIY